MRNGENRARTDGSMLAKHILYQLSYIPMRVRTMGFEPIPSAWKAENLPLIYIRNNYFYILSMLIYLFTEKDIS